MKKLAYILVAVMLVIGLSQCKKNAKIVTPEVSESVSITLDVSGSKVVVNPGANSATVTFKQDDKVLVASNGKYVGDLTYDESNGKFAGDITDPVSGEKLYFYYLGNITPSITNDNSTITVDISDQSETYQIDGKIYKLPIISCGESSANYETGTTSFHSTLANQCALVKFNVETLASADILIPVEKNTVSFALEPTSIGKITYGQTNGGVINIGSGNGDKWAILLPQSAIPSGGTAYSADKQYYGTCATIPTIPVNGYSSTAIKVTVKKSISTIVGVVANGIFSVGQGRKVMFSQGNLQYIGSAGTPYWKFADNQYDILRGDQQLSTENMDRDILGWGTSGYPHRDHHYQPYSIEENNNQYNAYNSSEKNLYDFPGTADWGYNAIYNGGNVEKYGWHTLSFDEWEYLLDHRVTKCGLSHVHARLRFTGSSNDILGIIIMPDDYNNDENLKVKDGKYTDNIINSSTWSVLQSKGCVFLPIAGRRKDKAYTIGTSGYYWSGSYVTTYFAGSICITNGGHTHENAGRSVGMSVRLVYGL